MITAMNVLKGLREVSEVADLPLNRKTEVVDRFRFFEEQLATEPSQRDSRQSLCEKWKELETLVRGTRFGAAMAKDLKLRLVFQELAIPISEITAHSYDRWDADQFFRYLRTQIDQRQTVTKRDQTLAQIGLKYLETEAARTRVHRDMDAIQMTWKEVKPLLSRAGLLSQFSQSRTLRTRIQFFLTGRFA